jgi:hypothetical protein
VDKSRITVSKLHNHACEDKIQPQAVDFFYQFFTEEWMQKICDATNAHVICKLDTELSPCPPKLHELFPWPPAWTTTWKPINVPEFKSWLALLIFLGMNRLDNKSDDEMWSEGWWNSNPAIHNFMMCSRHQQIKAAVHFQTPEEDQEPGLHKIGKFMESVKELFHTSYEPDEEVSWDKMMVQFTGTSLFCFICQPKPTPLGLKFMGMYCMRTGYLWDFLLDTKRSKEGKVRKQILSVAKEFLSMGHHSYCNHTFTSPETIYKLFDLGHRYTGTVAKNMGMPAEWKETGGGALKVQG